MAWIAIISCCVLASSALAAEGGAGGGAEIYVSPTGDDRGPGTKEAPLATPAGARGAVRKLVAAGLKAPVTVLLAGGTYELEGPLELGPEDGGTEQHAVTWSALPGQSVVLSGGHRIAGWAKGKGEVWQTTVPGGQTAPGAREGPWRFRQLWVDGRRGVRARTPNADANLPCLDLKGAELSEDLKTHTYRFPPGVLKEWGNLADVEAVVFGEWEITRKRFQSADVAAGTAQMAGPHAKPHENIAPVEGRRFFIENALEELDEPGEWYLDRPTGVLSYWPRPGEDMTKAEVFAPRLARLLEVKGTPERPVRNLHFKGLAFQYTDWAPPPGGYLGIQACHFNTGSESGKSAHLQIDAAIRWDYAAECSLEDCELAHLGGCGIELVTRCTKDLLQGNRLFDISGSGVMLGGPEAEADVPKDNRIVNNHVYSCGRDYCGGEGIWVGFAQRTLIAHNEVHDLPYTGISLGWQWDPNATPARENNVEYNHIHDVMQRLCDGGGIYTLGYQPGSFIRGNYIHDVRRHPLAQGWPNNGMFLDQGTKDFTIENNLIHDTVGTPLRFNIAKENLVRGNIFAVGKAGPVEYNATTQAVITQENNTLVETGQTLPATSATHATPTTQATAATQAKDPRADEIRAKAGLEEPYRRKLLP